MTVLRPVLAYASLETRLFLRDPATLFFVFLTPIALLLSDNYLARLAASPAAAGRAQCAAISLVILTVSLFSVFAQLVSHREAGFFKRLLATPIQPLAILFAILLRALLVGSIAMCVILIVGFFAGLPPLPAAPLQFAAAFLAGATAFFSYAFLLSSFVRRAQTALSIAVLLLQPLLFLSGIVIPIGLLPTAMARAAVFLPSYHLMQLLLSGWNGTLGSDGALAALAVLGATAVLCTLIARRTFTWFT